ncbi:MAG: GEVED domain-containing protein [Bacteroidia bacterium]|jgi:hypothetical protein
MKKSLLTLFLSVSMYVCADAQVVSAYAFAQSTGTYTPITGGTVLGDTTVDEERYVDPATPLGGSTTTGVGFPIGFNFTYNSIVFDRIGINTNGWISFGQSSLTPSVNMASGSNYIVPLSETSSATPALLRNRLGALAMDLEGQNGSEIRIQTTGTAPNRVCVIQWSNFREYNELGDNFNFQIRLNETTNSIVFAYGSFTAAEFYKPQVGLSGTTPSDFNLRKTSSNWAATTAGTANTDTCRLSPTVKPSSGLMFTWTAPAACTGTPSPGTISGATGACSGVDFDLMVTGYTSGVSGLTFQWQSSTTSGGTFTNIPGETGTTLTTSQTAAMYYKVVVTCSGMSASTPEYSVPMNTFLNCYCATSTSCTLKDAILNVTLGTLNNTTTCGTNGYTMYNSSIPTLNKGTTYPISVTVDTGGTEHVSVWIDYNHSGTFDPTEYVYVGSGRDTTLMANIMIPNTASNGQTVMRVRLRWNTQLADTAACYDYTYGETEDYVVNIAGTSGVGIEENNMLNNVVIYPNPTAGVFNIAVNGGKFNEVAISVIDLQGKVVYSVADKNTASDYSKQINLEGLAKGIYYVKLSTELGVKVQKLIIQ